MARGMKEDPRMERRKAANLDDRTAGLAPQPIPGMPQKGNVMNYPMMDVEGQMGQQMGSGGAMFPYGDGGLDKEGQAALGNVGFVGRSNKPQNQVPGRSQNMYMDYNMQPQPNEEAMRMMEPGYEIAQADGLTLPGGDGKQKMFGAGGTPPYFVTGLGPTGAPMENGMGAPGSLPAQMTASMREGTLPLQGTQSADGMSTGRGGGRNKAA